MEKIFIWVILMAFSTTCTMGFVFGVMRNSKDRSKRDALAAALLPENLPLRQVSSIGEDQAKYAGETHMRFRRGFRSYFYNYLDEMAMSICASTPRGGPGMIYAVRRTCGETATCTDICTDPKLRQQGTKEVQSLQWACTESLHVYKRQPKLADNYEDYTDSHKLGLAVYRHKSCTVGGCGPNYCCCRAA